jgi:hypothetical protein
MRGRCTALPHVHAWGGASLTGKPWGRGYRNTSALPVDVPPVECRDSIFTLLARELPDYVSQITTKKPAKSGSFAVTPAAIEPYGYLPNESRRARSPAERPPSKSPPALSLDGAQDVLLPTCREAVGGGHDIDQARAPIPLPAVRERRPTEWLAEPHASLRRGAR